MRCFFIFTALLLITIYSSAQRITPTETDHNNTFTKIELNATTDERTWAAYLKSAAVLPAAAAASIPPGSYAVKVKFIVDQNGNVIAIKAGNNPGYGLARRAEKVIANYEGVWKPANQCGRNVKSYKEQVVMFVVKE